MYNIKNAEELIELIKSQNFIGTIEEIQVQQILFLDNYIRNNIDYGFEAVQFNMDNPNNEKDNPYKKAFSEIGFFENKIAVCGAISRVAKKVFDGLDIKNDYVWGNITMEQENNNNVLGHRWNYVIIGNHVFMIDYTLSMCNSHKGEERYKGTDEMIQDYNDGFVFFDKLLPSQVIGGFKVVNGNHEQDIINGTLQNTFKDANEYFKSILPNLSLGNKEILKQILINSNNVNESKLTEKKL